MKKTFKILGIIFAIQINLIMAGWIYQEVSGNSVRGHVQNWYEEYKAEQRREEYQKAREKWLKEMPPERRSEYERRLAEIPKKVDKILKENKRRYKELGCDELLTSMENPKCDDLIFQSDSSDFFPLLRVSRDLEDELDKEFGAP